MSAGISAGGLSRRAYQRGRKSILDTEGPVVTVGGDPEVFVANEFGEIVTAIGKVPGTKSNPYATHHGAIQHDNVLAEFNITPATNPYVFADNTVDVLADLANVLNEHKCYYVIKSSHYMDTEQLRDPEAQQFGCSSDMDAWYLDDVVPPSPEQAGNLRTAGGHIHIGFDITEIAPDQVARACDLTLGLLTAIYDPDTVRATLYGQAGRFRIKPYGIEYRTPSAWWLENEEKMRMAFGAAKMAALNARQLIKEFGYNRDQALYLKAVINNRDAAEATKLLKNLSAAGIEYLGDCRVL